MSSDNAITRLLVANRGEIARRVFRTAHAMGIDTVAVFSDGDGDAPFVTEAAQAVALNGRTATETYLDAAKILDAAQRSGADAIHPGYGFLAENAEFAQLVIDAGLTWVGPSPASIASMGDKISAKALMADARVPTLASLEIDDETDIVAAAHTIGFPVLIKATAGGGGKGMRIVTSADEVVEAVAGAQREAAASFGNSTVFIEKYLPGPRHVEIQVLGDQHGNLVHLFERECSIQRRHQKIIEEAPSPAVTPTLRNKMGSAAVTAAKAIGYHSAGTVEFLVDGHGDDASFWFLEVNTRIQVEHPVTEEITGIDLIREQLRVAMGEPLDFTQDDLRIDGHAIEARLYAEDPAAGFLPAVGTLHAFAPPTDLGARVDSGVEAGSVVGVEFDPMLAKVIVHAPTRTEAAKRLALVLQRTALAGVVTNRDFLVATLRTPEFLAGDTTTDFIDRVQPWSGVPTTGSIVELAAIAATLFAQSAQRRESQSLPFMPSGYRNSSMPPQKRAYTVGDESLTVHYRPTRSHMFDITVEHGSATESETLATITSTCGLISLDDNGVRGVVEVNGVRSAVNVAVGPATVTVTCADGTVTLAPMARFPDRSAVDTAGGQTAPMPGRVLSVHVATGDTVVAGQTLVIIEAMKMEHTITAPADGTVHELRCAADDQVDNGQVLVVIGHPESDS